MAWMSLIEIARGSGGRLIRGTPARLVEGFAIDSRQVRPGDLFFALIGPNQDGHRFIPAALRAGACGVVAARAEAAAGAPVVVQADDTTRALQRLATHLRRTRRWRVVGITGSSGKTTTKEMTARLLSERYRVAASPGNLNNLYGLPLALLNCPDGIEVFVAEMGMSTPGEIATLGRIARPNVGALLNVGLAHRQNFSSLAQVAEAKGELIPALGAGGALAYNAGDPWVRRLARRHRGRKLSFGLGPRAQVRATGVRAQGGGTGCRLRIGRAVAPVHLPLPGRHQILNLLAAAALATLLGVPVEAIAARAGTLEPAPHRGQLRRLHGGAIAYDDSYNANPAAVRSALATIAELAGSGRRLAVLGDMLELGSQSGRAHRALGRTLARAGFDQLVLVGPQMELTAAAAIGSGYPRGRLIRCRDQAEATARLGPLLRSGDLVLIKGSHGVGLDRLVDALAEERE
jgi:UDP-N-acetylmuramoyl-tripeptide--D-alanyl-D-alanine ligase